MRVRLGNVSFEDLMDIFRDGLDDAQAHAWDAELCWDAETLPLGLFRELICGVSEARFELVGFNLGELTVNDRTTVQNVCREEAEIFAEALCGLARVGDGTGILCWARRPPEPDEQRERVEALVKRLDELHGEIRALRADAPDRDWN